MENRKGSTGWRTTPLPDDWKKIRLEILRRDNYKCQVVRMGKACPIPATEVDHIVRGENHDYANLQSICRLCHGRKTQLEGVEAKELRTKRPKQVHPFL